MYFGKLYPFRCIKAISFDKFYLLSRNPLPFQAQLKDAIRDAEEARLGREELQQSAKEAERKLKGIEAELIQVQEEQTASERQRRSAEAERDELQEELSNMSNKVYVHIYKTTCNLFIFVNCQNNNNLLMTFFTLSLLV